MEKCSKFYLFPKNFSLVIRQFWWPFFSHWPQISNFPLFSLFHYISPLFRENYYPPTFTNSPSRLRKIHLLFTYFMCISFPPYFDHDAFMHHPMQALDAPVGGSWFELNCPINTPMVGLLANTLPVLLRAFLLSLSCLVHSSCLPFHQMLLLFINAFLSSWMYYCNYFLFISLPKLHLTPLQPVLNAARLISSCTFDHLLWLSLLAGIPLRALALVYWSSSGLASDTSVISSACRPQSPHFDLTLDRLE